MTDQINKLQLGKDIAKATITAEQALKASMEAAKSSADNSVKLDHLCVQFEQIIRSVEELKKKVDHINGVDEKLAAQGFFSENADQNKKIMSFLRWISRYPKLTITVAAVLLTAILGESTIDLVNNFKEFLR